MACELVVPHGGGGRGALCINSWRSTGNGALTPSLAFCFSTACVRRMCGARMLRHGALANSGCVLKRLSQLHIAACASTQPASRSLLRSAGPLASARTSQSSPPTHHPRNPPTQVYQISLLAPLWRHSWHPRQPPSIEGESDSYSTTERICADSTKRKRRRKINRHKLRKRRKANRHAASFFPTRKVMLMQSRLLLLVYLAGRRVAPDKTGADVACCSNHFPVFLAP